MATSLAICKIFEQVYKILLQDVSDFDASQPASFLQEPYVWVVTYTFNFNFDNPCHPMYSNLCTITTLYCLSQSVTGPTHVHHDSSESTIDLVFVSEPSLLNTCDTIPPLSNSDHRGILMELSQKSVKAEKSQDRLIWRYSYANWDKACKLIDENNWGSILSENIKLFWELWHKQFMSVMAQSLPNRVVSTNRKLPWLNKSIVKLMTH